MFSRINCRIAFAAWRQPRAMLWGMAGVTGFGFLIALEIAARRYGLPGPITNQAREVIFAPKSGFLLYAGMALMMVVLPRRQRFIAVSAAIGIDVAFFLVRWAVDAKVTDGHPFGNGALWVILGHAVIAMTRRTGRERVLLLKGVGLGLLLVTGRKTGDTWLLITSKIRPTTLDQHVATADHALANPSWLVGRIVTATGPIGAHVLGTVYVQLAVAAVIVALYQLRNVAVERRFPRHHLVRTFLVIGLVGLTIYMIFPVVGPVFAYGADGGHWAVADVWPNTPPPINAPHHLPFDEITPRNCMPSLHTAWATAIFIHSRKGLNSAIRRHVLADCHTRRNAGIRLPLWRGSRCRRGVRTHDRGSATLARPWLGPVRNPAGHLQCHGLRRALGVISLSAGADGQPSVGVWATSHSGDGLSGPRLRTDRQTVGPEGRTGAASGTATRTGLSHRPFHSGSLR